VTLFYRAKVRVGRRMLGLPLKPMTLESPAFGLIDPVTIERPTRRGNANDFFNSIRQELSFHVDR
jgi:hypothetical protein